MSRLHRAVAPPGAPTVPFPSPGTEYKRGKRYGTRGAPATIGARFWTKVDFGTEPDSCWIWQGATNLGGYGQLRIDGQGRLAHRVAWEQRVGPIPDGLHIDHLCRNRRCVNVYHLEVVTQAENNRRSVAVRLEDKRWCKNKLHPLPPGPGYCHQCKLATNRRAKAAAKARRNA